MYSITRGSC